MKLNIVLDDITKIKVDGIVNAANKSLLGGGGVDGAIHKAAGPKLLQETKTLNGCKVGEAKITRGYKLPAKYIIHTVGPVWRGGDKDEATLLENAYKNSLELAKENKLKSLAFPLISAGVYGYPREEAIKIALTTIEKFLQTNKMKVSLVLHSEETFKLAKEIGEEMNI